MTGKAALLPVAAVGGLATAAGLLVTIGVLARRIAREARELQEPLNAARDNAAALFDIPHANATLKHVTKRLAEVREELEPAP